MMQGERYVGFANREAFAGCKCAMAAECGGAHRGVRLQLYIGALRKSCAADGDHRALLHQ